MSQDRENPPLDREIEAALEGMSLQDVDLPSKRTGGGREERLHRGTVVGVHGNDVIVDLGPRAQGVASLGEFDEPPEVGATFDFSLHGREDDLWLLSRKEALALAAWDDVAPGGHVKARVTGQNKGGLELKVGPLSAFMPASHVALGREEDLSGYLGQSLVCEVLEVDTGRKRILLSRRKVLEVEREAAQREHAERLEPGHVLTGKVTRVEPFGAFVDLGSGVEGLVHVSNLSRKRVEDPSEFVSKGQEVRVQVLEIKEGGRRIGLGMKQLEPDPWDEAVGRFPVDAVVTGKVTRVADFGAFVELADGLEGLLHVSQLGRDRVQRVRDAVTEGQELAVRILAVEPHQRRISLTRLDPRGAVIGSEDAVDSEVIDSVLHENRGSRAGTNLGSLFRKALRENDDR